MNAVAVTGRSTCAHCDAHVSDGFRRVYGDGFDHIGQHGRRLAVARAERRRHRVVSRGELRHVVGVGRVARDEVEVVYLAD